MEKESGLPDEYGLVDFKLFNLETSEGNQCTLLQAQRTKESTHSPTSDTLNVLMADVSGSMSGSWRFVVEGWNTYIQEKLNGVTKLYVFSSSVEFLREDTHLREKDFCSGGTNITKALEVIQDEVKKCKQSFVQIFIITDGGHGSGAPLPEVVINEMSAPPGKTVNVYLLGITPSFPVNYSIDIRSRLHNGSANLPSLYWAKESLHIIEQMEAIGSDVGDFVKMVLSQEGYILPGLPGTRTIHLNEWLYFPKAPEEVVNLKVSINDGEQMKIRKSVTEASVSTLLDHLFPQWNSVLIQRHRKKQEIPKEIFSLMDSMFKSTSEKLKKPSMESKQSIMARIMKKELKNSEVKYKTLMNTSRAVIEVEGRYADEIELANNILKSTVSGRKYDTRVLKIRGHGLDDYSKDIAEFFSIYKEHERAIKALPMPEPEECCRITMSSTLSDLQDEDFSLMQDLEKFDFLKNFSMSGIPAYAPVRDAAKINPWVLRISHILVTPYTVLSQRAIEAFAEVEGESNLGATDRDVKLMNDDEKTRFNIVIPTIPASAATVLKPLVCSNIYAMLATFSILKDPHIIDYSAHLAALASAWVKSVTDHPPASRPEYVTDRLASIVATAELYMDRRGIMHYLEALANTPNKALMTEFTDPINNETLKCESLIKPIFLLAMRKNKFTTPQVTAIMRLLLAEFIGRCLSNYKNTDVKATPFTDFFVAELIDPVKREEWLTRESQSIIDEFKSSSGDLLKKFYTPEAVQKEFLTFVNSKSKQLSTLLINSITIAVDMKKVERLKYVGSCGDVTFHAFNTWAQEMGVPEGEILAAYDPSKVTVYVCEALSFRSSKERLGKEQRSYTDCMEHIKSHLCEENQKSLLETLKMKVNEVVDQWTTQYMKVHEPLVMPLTLQQVVSQAQAQNIAVTEETFYQKYRYDAKSKLLRNACQIPDCPYYLLPSRSFNQHLAVERVSGNFPHSLHLVSMELNSENVEKVMELVISGEHSGRNGRMPKPMSENISLLRLKPDIEQLQKIYNGMSI